MKCSCQHGCTWHWEVCLKASIHKHLNKEGPFSRIQVSSRWPQTPLLISSLIKTLQTRGIPVAAARIYTCTVQYVHSYTCNKSRHRHTQALVSIFRVSSGKWRLNLERHFVKQIQHQHVGGLSKTRRPSVSVSAHVYVLQFIFLRTPLVHAEWGYFNFAFLYKQWRESNGEGEVKVKMKKEKLGNRDGEV